MHALALLGWLLAAAHCNTALYADPALERHKRSCACIAQYTPVNCKCHQADATASDLFCRCERAQVGPQCSCAPSPHTLCNPVCNQQCVQSCLANHQAHEPCASGCQSSCGVACQQMQPAGNLVVGLPPLYSVPPMPSPQPIVPAAASPAPAAGCRCAGGEPSCQCSCVDECTEECVRSCATPGRPCLPGCSANCAQACHNRYNQVTRNPGEVPSDLVQVLPARDCPQKCVPSCRKACLRTPDAHAPGLGCQDACVDMCQANCQLNAANNVLLEPAAKPAEPVATVVPYGQPTATAPRRPPNPLPADHIDPAPPTPAPLPVAAEWQRVPAAPPPQQRACVPLCMPACEQGCIRRYLEPSESFVSTLTPPASSTVPRWRKTQNLREEERRTKTKTGPVFSSTANDEPALGPLMDYAEPAPLFHQVYFNPDSNEVAQVAYQPLRQQRPNPLSSLGMTPMAPQNNQPKPQHTDQRQYQQQQQPSAHSTSGPQQLGGRMGLGEMKQHYDEIEAALRQISEVRMNASKERADAFHDPTGPQNVISQGEVRSQVVRDPQQEYIPASNPQSQQAQDERGLGLQPVWMHSPEPRQPSSEAQLLSQQYPHRVMIEQPRLKTLPQPQQLGIQAREPANQKPMEPNEPTIHHEQPQPEAVQADEPANLAELLKLQEQQPKVTQQVYDDPQFGPTLSLNIQFPAPYKSCRSACMPECSAQCLQLSGPRGAEASSFFQRRYAKGGLAAQNRVGHDDNVELLDQPLNDMPLSPMTRCLPECRRVCRRECQRNSNNVPFCEEQCGQECMARCPERDD